MDPEIVERLNEQFREMSDILSQQNASMAAMMKAMNDQATASNKAAAGAKNQTNAANANAAATEGLTKKQLAYQQAEQERIEAANRTIQKFNKAVDFTASTVHNLGSAILDSSSAFKKYTGVVGGLGDAALSLGKQFGVLGTVLGGVVKGYTFLLEKQLEQAENLLTFNDQVSKLGAANAFSTEQIRGMANQAGIFSWELDKLTKPMQSMGANFKAMGSGTAEATKAFMGMVDVGKEARKEFQRLGYNDAERIEAQSKFISTMTESGRSIKTLASSTSGLAKISLEYQKNLTVISEITGKTAEQQQEQQKINAANMQWQVYEAQMAKKIREADTEAEKEKLRKELESSTKVRDVLASRYGEVGAAMAGQYYSGNPVTLGISETALTGTTSDVYKMLRGGKEGMSEKELGDLAQRIAVKQQDATVRFGTALSLDQSGDFAKSMGLTPKTMAETNIAADRESGKAAQTALDAIAANTAGKGPAAEDPAQKMRNFLEEEVRKPFGQMMDDLVASTNPLLGNIGSFAVLSAAAIAASIALGGLAFAAGKNALGGGLPGGGPGGKGGFGAGAKGDLSKIRKADLLDKRGKMLQGDALTQRLNKLAGTTAQSVDDVAQAAKSTSKMGKLLSTSGKWLGRAGTVLAIGTAAYEGYSGYQAASAQEKAGQITAAEASKKKGEAVGGAVGGGVGGIAGGAAMGAMVGSVVPVVGTAIGGIIGGALGYYLGDKLGTAIGGAVASEDEDKAKTQEPKAPEQPKAPQMATAEQQAREEAQNRFIEAIAAFGSIVSSFGKITISFASIVTTFAKIVSSNAIAVKAFATTVKAFATTVRKLAEIIKAPQQKTPVVESVMKAMLDGKSNDRMQRRQSNLENIIGNTLLETDESLSPLERFEVSIEGLSDRLDTLREAENKRHMLTELSMKQFRQSLDDASKKLDKISGITRGEDDDKDDSGGGGGGGTGAGSSENAQKAMEYFMKQGWSKEQAAGIVGNLQQESGKDLDPGAENSTGMYGIAQWDKKRRKDFEKFSGKSIYGSSLEDQLAFVQHELTEGKDGGAKKAGRKLKDADTANEAASIFEKYYERSGGSALGKRIANAEALMTDKADNAPVADKKLISSKPDNVKLGDGADLSGVNSTLLSKFFTAAKEFGKPITVNSAYRSDADQAELWVRGRILGEPGIHTPARPKNTTTINYKGKEYTVDGSGKGSKHGSGQAIDISGDLVSFDSVLNRYGLNRPFKRKDPPHLELKARKGGVFDGPDSGYPVEMHGGEMIAPLSTNSVLMKLAKTPADSEDVKQSITPNISSEKETVEKLVNMNSEMFGEMLNRLAEMVEAINDGNDTRQKILKNSQT